VRNRGRRWNKRVTKIGAKFAQAWRVVGVRGEMDRAGDETGGRGGGGEGKEKRSPRIDKEDEEEEGRKKKIRRSWFCSLHKFGTFALDVEEPAGRGRRGRPRTKRGLGESGRQK